MKNSILILIIFFTLISCSREIDLDKEKKIELSFEQLPPELREIYSSIFIIANDTIDYYVYSLDKKYELTHYWTGINNQLLSKGFNHHFVINKREFKLRANQGDPFVLQNKKLYYTTELNLAEYNFEKAKYVEIDLAEFLVE